MDQTKQKKRVLFISPGKRDGFYVNVVNMGLGVMSSILCDAGHEVKLVDYAYLLSIEDKLVKPDIKDIIDEFNPDVIGIAVFTYLYKETQEFIEQIVSRNPEIPIILGGSHLTVYPEDFNNDKRISYIVAGDAETVILDLVENAKKEAHPVVMKPGLTKPELIPYTNLNGVYGVEHLTTYQLQLSRGCPYRCTFCNVKTIASYKIRARELDDCINEIVEAKKNYPNINHFTVTDDLPTWNRKRFNKFLQMFKDAETGCELSMSNTRADAIDDDMMRLYKDVGGTNVCLGVESGHPEVFRLANKGEKLEKIVEGAKIVRKAGLTLGVNFVIGLPGDNWENHKESIRFAKSLHPNYIFWNLCLPWPETKVHEWYSKNGKIDDVRDFSTLIDSNADFEWPTCSSPSFSKMDMVRAWLMANFETNSYFSCTYKGGLLKILKLCIKYRIYKSFFVFMFKIYPKILFRKINLDRLKSFIKAKFPSFYYKLRVLTT